MEITLQCPVCKSQNEINDTRFGIEYSSIYNSDNNISIIDDFRRGHYSVVYFTNNKFDLLFESGLSAVHDKYLREAVASIAASLERFYEYCIEIFTFNLDKEKYNKIWKNISNQSERQIGAYYFLFFNSLNEVPQFLSDKDVSFRNKVIHKGYFPTKNETLDFIIKVFQIIKNNFNLISSQFLQIIDMHKDNYIQNLIEESENIIKIETKELENLDAAQKVSGGKRYPCYFAAKPFERTIKTFLSVNINSGNDSEIERYIQDFQKFNVD